MRFSIFRPMVCASLLALPFVAHAADEVALEEVIVTATLRPQSLQDVPSSVTVLDSQTLKDAGQQHFQDVLGLVPNLNWSAGTSRPRYFQLRGIGELEQYQGAPNPSVGFLVDDVDFSGVGGLATLIDVDQIEVLRGPQGTNYGANALAGLIKIKTRDPRPVYELSTEAGIATYGASSVGLVAGGPLSIAGTDSAFRIVAQRYRGNGFVENIYRDRHDTNGFDETTLRGKTRFELGSDLKVDLSGLYVNQDNGYDAWSLDNSRVTRSDYPGRDAQRSKAIDAHVTYKGLSGVNIESITTYAATDQVYSFDADWANDNYWNDATSYSPYNWYSDIKRDRITRSQEFRFSSNNGAFTEGSLSWVGGIYLLNLRETNVDTEFAHDQGYYPISNTDVLSSKYTSTNYATYGQVEYGVNDSITFSTGIRLEHRDTQYQDTETTPFSPKEDMIGGVFSFSRRASKSHSQYISLSRGYKAGGVNIGLSVPESLQRFSDESLWSLDAGDRREWLDGALLTDVSIYYMHRQNEQVSSSISDPGNPARFIFITGNADRGRNYGLEFQFTFRPDRHWEYFGTLSLLDARVYDYSIVDKYTYSLETVDSRKQAHSPSYQFSLGAGWHGTSGLMARVDVTGKGSFYFDTSHNQTSSAYQLINAKIGYEVKQWSVYLWGNNLMDKSYAVRGFYFGLEPPDFGNSLYLQKGDPRQIGVTANWKF